MNLRNYALIGSAIGFAILFGFLFFSKNDKNTLKKMDENSSVEEYKKMDDISRTMGGSMMGNYVSIFDDNSFPNSGEFIDALRIGKVNFIWELWALRDKCSPEITMIQCNNMILGWIDEKFPPPGNEEVKKLFRQYFEYEAEMVRKEKKQGLFDDSYEEIKKMRREFFKNEEAELVFGMEEAQVDFMKESREFIERSNKMSGEDRVKQYESLKKKVYGNFYDSMVSREEKYDHYQTELYLREKDLSSLSSEQKETQIRKIQEKYFGKEGAERIAKVQKEEEEFKKKIADYDKKEADFIKENASLKPEDLQKKLTEFRVQNLGAEEAEMYARRKMLDDYGK